VELYGHVLRSTIRHSALPASPSRPHPVPTVKSLSARNDPKSNQTGIVRMCTMQYCSAQCITGVPTWLHTVPTVRSLVTCGDLKPNQSGIVRTCTKQYRLALCITGVPTWRYTVPTVRSLVTCGDLKPNQTGIVWLCTAQYPLAQCDTIVSVQPRPVPVTHICTWLSSNGLTSYSISMAVFDWALFVTEFDAKLCPYNEGPTISYAVTR